MTGADLGNGLFGGLLPTNGSSLKKMCVGGDKMCDVVGDKKNERWQDDVGTSRQDGDEAGAGEKR